MGEQERQRREKVKSEQPALRRLFPDYDPRRHETFRLLAQEMAEKKALRDYMAARGVR